MTGSFDALLEAAAAPTLRRIRQDAARVSERMRPLLEHIAEHLFSPELNVSSLKAACRVRDNNMTLRFHQEVSVPPKRYIHTRRMEVAVRLLATTTLKIWQISDLLGYSGIVVFSKGFQRFAHMRPRAYRRLATQSKPEALLFADPTVPERALGGSLDETEAELLLTHLEVLYPRVLS